MLSVLHLKRMPVMSPALAVASFFFSFLSTMIAKTMQALEKRYYSPQEYLELLLVPDIRNEYINGEIVPMTGGLPNHNQISLNLA